jgi:hypothetical protein
MDSGLAPRGAPEVRDGRRTRRRPVVDARTATRREPIGLTRDFKETVKARAERDVRFREALLTEAVELLITGEVEVGKAVLRDCRLASSE